MKSPIETLFVIADSSKMKTILKYLTSTKLMGKIIMSGKGTAKSAIGDIFGFGIIEKDVIMSFVPCEKAESVCTKLNKLINKENHQGIIFTVPVDAISSDLFELVKGGKNG